MTRALLLALLSLGVGGCVSWVAVEKIPAGDTITKGIRYALPVPFVVVTPRPDGGVDVKIEYLPDPDNQYAVRSWSFLSSYTLDVALERGLLTAVTYKSDNTGVASQLVQSAGNLAKTRLEAAAAAETAKGEQAASVQADVRRAQAELQRLVQLAAEGKDVADKIVEAEVKVAVARANLESARKSFAAVRGSAFRVASAAAPAAPTGSEAPPEMPKAWGPVLYRVVDDASGVRLVPVVVRLEPVVTSAATQQLFETSKLPAVPAPELPPAAFAIAGPPTILPDRQGNLRFKAVSSRPLGRILELDVRLWAVRPPQPEENVTARYPPLVARQPSGVSVIVDLDPSTVAGDYRLDIVYETPSAPVPPDKADVRFRVRRP